MIIGEPKGPDHYDLISGQPICPTVALFQKETLLCSKQNTVRVVSLRKLISPKDAFVQLGGVVLKTETLLDSNQNTACVASWRKN